MRVLVVHNRYRSEMPSGENAVVEQEVALLLEHGVDVHQLTVESDDIAGWGVVRKAMLPASVVWSRNGARTVGERIDALRPDVVHFHNTFPLLSPASLRRAARPGVRVVKTLHNYRPICPAGRLFRDGRVCESCVGRVPVPAVIHGCYRGSRAATTPIAISDAVHATLRSWGSVQCYITPSEFVRSRYVAAGWPADRIVVKYNSADDTEALRQGAGAGYVCIARLEEEKGIGVLLDAWRIAFPDGGPGLDIIGSGDLQAELSTAAASVPGARMLGRLETDDVQRRVRSARAVVVPSVWYEVFGRVVAEAYAAGVPVIASRIGGLPELVRDGETGHLVDPGDPDDLARALLAQENDPMGSQTMGAAARSLYDEAFSPEVIVDRLCSIYRGDAVVPTGELAA